MHANGFTSKDTITHSTLLHSKVKKAEDSQHQVTHHSLCLRSRTEPPASRCNALCGYPIGKMEIRDSSQISTTAPIFQQYNYFRQNLEENVTFTFYFFSFASNFPCKICDGQIHAWKNIGKYLYILNIKIHNEGLPP